MISIAGEVGSPWDQKPIWLVKEPGLSLGLSPQLRGPLDTPFFSLGLVIFIFHISIIFNVDSVFSLIH